MTNSVDWGPKPFRFINAWMSDQSFMKKVKESWTGEGIEGWGCYGKKRNKENFDNFDVKVQNLRDELHDLDIWDDAGGSGRAKR